MGDLRMVDLGMVDMRVVDILVVIAGVDELVMVELEVDSFFFGECKFYLSKTVCKPNRQTTPLQCILTAKNLNPIRLLSTRLVD